MAPLTSAVRGRGRSLRLVWLGPCNRGHTGITAQQQPQNVPGGHRGRTITVLKMSKAWALGSLWDEGPPVIQPEGGFNALPCRIRHRSQKNMCLLIFAVCLLATSWPFGQSSPSPKYQAHSLMPHGWICQLHCKENASRHTKKPPQRVGARKMAGKGL